jgi:dTMP kinase
MPGSLGGFVVIEGPNGAGKTTVCDYLTRALVAVGYAVHPTAEPTKTLLGRAIRELEASLPPESLALCCAADRYDHVAREIEPALRAQAWVVCDRYVPSSLVLQRLDGLALDWIWRLNNRVVRPDLTVYLEHDPETISSRLDQRGRVSRFEQQGSSRTELQFYAEARDFLASQGWKQIVVDCRSRSPTDIAAEIVTKLV